MMRLFLFLCFACAIITTPLKAEDHVSVEQSTEIDFLSWDYATGDWAGARTKLEDAGVVVALT